MATDARPPWTAILATLAVAAVVAGGIAGALALRGGGEVTTIGSTAGAAVAPPGPGTADGSDAPAPSATAPPSTAPPTTAPPGDEEPVPDDPRLLAVWPHVASDVRYTDPVAAARGFAEDFVGFTDPVVGEFRAGDGRSGEVPIRPRADGVVTTVLVRQLDDGGTWWVLGSHTDDIRLDEPIAGAGIAPPVVLRGEALAFEGTVQVDVRADGHAEPIGHGFVTGSGGPEPGPFEGPVPFADPGDGWGSLVLHTYGGEDPVLWQATVVRVRFGQG